MNISLPKAKKLARMLLRENRSGRSYRTISREDYQGRIDQSTLSRIARGKGTWLPRDEKILVILGLKKPCVPKSPPAPVSAWLRDIRKRIAGMAKDTRRNVLRQNETPN